MVQDNSKYILDYISIAPVINAFRINIAISLNMSWNKNLNDDPLFLSHFWLIYVLIFHFGKYQELFNSRSKMAHLPLSMFDILNPLKAVLPSADYWSRSDDPPFWGQILYISLLGKRSVQKEPF